MTVLAKIGERTYEFESKADVTTAREIYSTTTKDQNGFEDDLEHAGINFVLEFE